MRKKRDTAAGRRSEIELVTQVLETAKQSLGRKEVTIAEFIKLLQLRKELEQEDVKTIEVQWVEPTETEDAGKQ